MGDFWNFRKMITPMAIQIIFWIGAAVAVISGVVQVFSGMVLAGLLWIILGPILVRVWCELTILAFKIYEELLRIDTNTGRAVAPATSTTGGDD